LIEIKARANSFRDDVLPIKGDKVMPRENALILIAIVVPFVVFALTLAWGDFQTRRIGK
jgi:multisubunit Na+/H+ antiporter MnhC subunit